MSKTTKKKHVSREVLEDFFVPEGDELIARVVCGRGNNLHEVENARGEKFLCSMPSKFRRSVWIKRGDFVIVEPIEEGNKVKAEIIHILYPKQIRYLKHEKAWPVEFQSQDEIEKKETRDDDKLFVNPNRQHLLDDTSSSSSYSSSHSDDESKD